MIAATNAWDNQTSFIARPQNLILVHMAHHLDAFEPGLFNDLHLLPDGSLHADSGPHDSVFQTNLVCPGTATCTIGAGVCQVRFSGTSVSWEFIAASQVTSWPV